MTKQELHEQLVKEAEELAEKGVKELHEALLHQRRCDQYRDRAAADEP